tara:strand:- start:75 stop:257 length:183 start_codon:yes stop_codon:yes gene_type:complete
MSTQVDEPIKNADCNLDTLDDDFMCIMRADNSTIVCSKGVVVTGTPLGKPPVAEQKVKVL